MGCGASSQQRISSREGGGAAGAGSDPEEVNGGLASDRVLDSRKMFYDSHGNIRCGNSMPRYRY